ncbi:hypothetical protein A6X21_06860 [Planctopirus hydrillae]|uniref:Uncharacterized protein n=1 Tax=Planctopirus hydrillae TaxID=1841610 RepID=A0A1C3E9Z2_9PLAN|nr:hypothetical protein A6X21_06860 [Planctopirus hydrillae]
MHSSPLSRKLWKINSRELRKTSQKTDSSSCGLTKRSVVQLPHFQNSHNLSHETSIADREDMLAQSCKHDTTSTAH